jgi:hypothetical protein
MYDTSYKMIIASDSVHMLLILANIHTYIIIYTYVHNIFILTLGLSNSFRHKVRDVRSARRPLNSKVNACFVGFNCAEFLNRAIKRT